HLLSPTPRNSPHMHPMLEQQRAGSTAPVGLHPYTPTYAPVDGTRSCVGISGVVLHTHRCVVLHHGVQKDTPHTPGSVTERSRWRMCDCGAVIIQRLLQERISVSLGF
ncbi:uncharacterized, partial [Tachysurus ichikawai]